MKHIGNFEKFSKTEDTVSEKNSTIKKLFGNLFKKAPQKVEAPVEIEEVKLIVKVSPPVDSEFMKNFDTANIPKLTNKPEIVLVPHTPSPMRMTKSNRDLLKQSIVISLELPVDRSDLEFVGFSRMDGRAIYRYKGSNFSTFNIPYEEVISLESYLGENWMQSYSRSHSSKRR